MFKVSMMIGLGNPWQHVGKSVLYLSERQVTNTVQVDRAFISQVVEDVEGTHRLRASLLVAKN